MTVTRFRFVQVLCLSVAILFTAAAPVAASQHYYSADRIWLSIGLWGGWDYNTARWDVTLIHEDGQNYWAIRNLELSSVVTNGRQCDDAEYCEGWLFSASVKFKNASGGVYTTISPAPGSCYSYWLNTTDKYFYRCRVSEIDIPYAYSTMQTTWTTSVERRDDIWFNWGPQTRSFPID